MFICYITNFTALVFLDVSFVDNLYNKYVYLIEVDYYLVCEQSRRIQYVCFTRS